MDELKEIREALSFYANLESWGPDDWGVLAVVQPPAYGDPTAIADRGLAALSRLEAREAERDAAIARHVEFPNEAEAPKDVESLVGRLADIGQVLSRAAWEYYTPQLAAEIERLIRSRIAAAKKSEPDFLSQALNEGDGVYRP